MKSFNNITTAALVAVFSMGLGLIPQKAQASNALVNGTGVSDETLFVILTVIAIFQLLAIIVVANVIKSIVQNKDVWQNRWNKGAAVITALMVFTSSSTQAAPTSDFDMLVSMNDTGFIVLITLNLFLFAAFIYLVSKLNGLFKMLRKDEEGKVPESFMDKVNAMLTDSVPVEEEKDVLMDHEYDGIHELDNNLPPWWLYGFYLSIVFAVVYIINYHVTDNGQLQLEEYQAEMQAAEEAKAEFVATQENVVDENNVERLTDEASLAAGAKTFKLYCVTCHAEHGGSVPGGVGPNLTDEYWIHGGSVTDIFKTIKYGVPEKGMVSWQAQLNPTQIQELSSYIKSLKGTNPPNAKEPQGELWQEEETAIKETPPAEDVDSTAAESSKPKAEDDVTMVD